MKKQQGAALIVVLSLLTVSLMLGLSGVQSSLVDERLAGNYKSASQAQMNAEKGLSEFYAWLSVNGWPKSGDQDNWQEELKLEGYSIFSYDGLSAGPDWNSSGGGTVSLMSRGSDGNAVSDVSAIFSFGLLGRLTKGAFTCYGVNCDVSPGSGNASNSFNGKDHEVDEDSGCSITGSNVPEEVENSESSAGVFLPDGTLESGAEENIDGLEDYEVVGDLDKAREYLGFDESASYSEVRDRLEELQQEFNDEMDSLVEGAVSSGSGEVSGMSVFHYAGPGDTVSLDGNAGGIIILEGGTLEMKGNSCFSGLVLARESSVESQIIVPEFDSRGTAAIVGGVVGQSVSFSGNGTPSVYYSSKAISEFSDPMNGAEGTGGISIEEWGTM